MSMEQVFTHGQIKAEILRSLANLLVESDLGLVLPDGTLFTNEEADLSGNPDLFFVSHSARESVLRSEARFEVEPQTSIQLHCPCLQ